MSEEAPVSHESLDVQLRVLPNKIRIGRVPHGSLSAATLPLMNLLLFPNESYVPLVVPECVNLVAFDPN